MAAFRDMLGREVMLDGSPKRIVSVVPSQTELLYDLGLEDAVVGITKFCVHPEKWFRSKTRIGGTKTLNVERILELQPDLIIANKEENTQADLEVLAEKVPVWISDIKTLQDALGMIQSLGILTGTAAKAHAIATEIEVGFKEMKRAENPLRVAYFIWYNPWMTVGSDTFIADVIRQMGWMNVFENETRYPEINLAKLAVEKPDVVLLSSEPFPFKEKHMAMIKVVCPQAEVMLVDGEMFSWYGSRLLHSVPYLQGLIAAVRK